MAARYLIIEFDDEASANALRARIDNATRSGKKFRVVGMFAKATKYCRCDPRTQVTTKTHQSPLKRGRKFGWWVCTVCRRPVSAMAGLVNLIKPRDIIDPPTFEVPMTNRGGPGYTAMHHITSLGVGSMGPGSIEFWNTREN